MRNGFLALAFCCLPLATSSCGYHVGGHTDALPKTIKTIAIPPLSNLTARYKLNQLLTTDISREFIARTRYQVVSDANQGDAILSDGVINFLSYPTVFDPVSGRASGVQVIVYLQLTLTDRKTGEVIFNRPNMEVRERYEISVDPKAYFDESGPAMTRLSQDVARSVVSAILENF